MNRIQYSHEVYTPEEEPRKWVGSLIIILAAATVGCLCFFLGREEGQKSGKEIGFNEAKGIITKRLTDAPSSLPTDVAEDFEQGFVYDAENDAAKTLLDGLKDLGYQAVPVDGEWAGLIQKKTGKPVTMPMTINGKKETTAIALSMDPRKGFKIAPLIGTTGTRSTVVRNGIVKYDDKDLTALFGSLPDLVEAAKRRIDVAPHYGLIARENLEKSLKEKGLKIVTKDFGN